MLGRHCIVFYAQNMRYLEVSESGLCHLWSMIVTRGFSTSPQRVQVDNRKNAEARRLACLSSLQQLTGIQIEAVQCNGNKLVSIA